MRSPFVAGGFLVISLTIISLIGYSIYQKDLRVTAEAALVAQGLELEGAKKALMVSPKEVVKFVTVPAAVSAAVKKGVLTPIAAGKFEAKSGTVEVPCPSPVGVEVATDPTSPPPPSPTPPTTLLTFGLTGEFFIGKINHGAVEYTSTLKGTVWNDTWHADIPFEDKDVRFDIKVSNDISKAIDGYNEPWIKKHTALSCPGLSVTYNPLDTGRPVNIGISCGYSFVWF